MSRILVTGGTGTLGRELVSQLSRIGHTVRVMSRQYRAANVAPELEWAQAELETGAGLKEAVEGVDVIVYAASNPRQNTYQADVEGTRKLLEHAHTAKVSHFVYVSIVGIERIPYSYYQIKVQTEAVVRESSVPYSILRATQFHDFLDLLGTMADRVRPFLILPTDLQFQPVDTSEVAARLVEIAGNPPGGLLPDMGGPEILRVRDLVRVWLDKRGIRRVVLPLYLPGKVAHGFRHGYHTCPDHRDGKITWAQWLDRKYKR